MLQVMFSFRIRDNNSCVILIEFDSTNKQKVSPKSSCTPYIVKLLRHTREESVLEFAFVDFNCFFTSESVPNYLLLAIEN